MALSMVNSIMKWNPFSSSFATYDSKLKLYDVIVLPDGSRDAVLSKSMNISGEVTTLDWYQDSSVPKALAFGTSVASVYFLNWSKGQPEYFALRQAKKSRQQCTEVTWNRFQFPNQVAAGFDKSKKFDLLQFLFLAPPPDSSLTLQRKLRLCLRSRSRRCTRFEREWRFPDHVLLVSTPPPPSPPASPPHP
jgi:hypothetical protein